MTETRIHPALAAGNVAVVTGGAGGIGLAAARRFAEMGLRVCIADLGHAALEAAATSIGGDVLTVETDVSDRQAVAKLAAIVAERLGPVAVIMNNAGVGSGGDALSALEGWDRVLGVNLMGILHGVHCFVPAMVAGGAAGMVINTGSKQGITQPPGDTAYNVSKAGVKALTEGLAHSLREQSGARVTAHLLIPGFTYTGLTARRMAYQPPGAWTPDQVVDRMLQGLAREEFYILCQDNETTREQDEKRILWAAQDITENRPALSRWHPDWKDAFTRYMSEEKR